MPLVLLALFLGIPLVEIALFVVVGEQIGALATVALVILTTVVGVVLVRRQGLGTLARARADIERDVMPAGPMAEGLAILLAGGLLVLPGFLTDTIGFALLVPPVRRAVIAVLGVWLAARVTIVGTGAGASRGTPRRGDVIDVEAVEIDTGRIEGGETGTGPGAEGARPSPWRGR